VVIYCCDDLGQHIHAVQNHLVIGGVCLMKVIKIPHFIITERVRQGLLGNYNFCFYWVPCVVTVPIGLVIEVDKSRCPIAWGEGH
jgi:hypothetical protein